MKYIHKYIEQRCDNSLEVPNHRDPIDVIVVIPVYDETIDNVLEVVKSLDEQSQPNCFYAVYILINTHDRDDARLVDASVELFNKLISKLSSYTNGHTSFHVFYKHFSLKKSGVGHARKVLMDTAFRYFFSQNKNGIIVNIDADTTCSNNYIGSIIQHFNSYPETEAASIRYEHKVSTDTHPIIDYELHLRYFINMQRLLRLPFAYQTIGSAMAVRAYAYAKEGGMNTRQAGEDFYFLHKYSKNLSLSDLSDTKVVPSHRMSARVPFGTGKAVTQASKEEYVAMSYNYNSFIELKKWVVDTVKVLLHTSSKNYKYIPSSSETLNNFMNSISAKNNINRIVLNSDNELVKYKGFFSWFNAFQLMKCLHFLRENGYPDMPIDICIKNLFSDLNAPFRDQRVQNLYYMRQYDKKATYMPDYNDFI